MIRIVTYNTQFCTGLDGRTDIDRIAAEIAGADIMALQEIDRHWQRTGLVDQVQEIADRFPKYYWTYGPGIDVDACYHDENDRLVNRRRQFGNMVLSRWPLLMVRNHLLPKLHLRNPLSLQRSALETIVDLPDGPCRVVSVHLAHAASSERLIQIERLLQILKAAPADGGAWSGTEYDQYWAQEGLPHPQPYRTVVLGDFNCEPGSKEHEMLCGALDPAFGPLSTCDGLCDAWLVRNDSASNGATHGLDKHPRRLDYSFMTHELTQSLGAIWVDQKAVGSDHKPVWIEIDV
jgi:endonuclease/exonuclease/phosphatase family metal-dependent hydrolase